MLNLKSAATLGGLLLASAAVLPAAAQDQALIDAAKAEGMLTTIALPHDWCNYGGVIEGFKAKYGLEVNELNPDAGSADELEAIRANKDNKGPQAPGRHRRRLRLRPGGQGRGADPALQGLDLGHDPRQRQGRRTATGSATTTGC